MKTDIVYYKDARKMEEVDDNSVRLIITSPPYWNIKDYSLNGTQDKSHSEHIHGQIGDITDYNEYINEMLSIWKECERVLMPNGKLCINVPLMPAKKEDLTTHYNRHLFDINSDIEQSILNGTNMFLYDMYIWNRTNSSKNLMFGSYPYPANFYALNNIEFITLYVKDGTPEPVDEHIKEKSKLTKEQFVEFTIQVWELPVPNKGDKAFGKHSAIMPKKIVERLVILYSFWGDVVLDPFCGSGTTLEVAQRLGRSYIGYEIYRSYEKVINNKLNETDIFGEN
jgi:site-specific DNA-methyltransferase (cytosine-N4-specific)